MAAVGQLPTLSTFQAHALALCIAGSYVGSLYVSQSSRITYHSDNPTEKAKERVKRRDDPDVIRARLIAVSVSTLLSCLLIFGIIRYNQTEISNVRLRFIYKYLLR